MRRTLTASLLSTILLGSIFTVARADTTVRLGVGTADITFHIGAGQGGWGERWRVYHTDSQPVETNMYARLMRSTEGVHMNQRIKAFVFDDGTRLRAVLSNDLLGSVQYFHRAIADQIADDPGIAWQDLMLTATHSESNPTNGTISPLLTAYAGVFDEEFARTVLEGAVHAIRDAVDDLEPVRYAAGATEVDAVSNFVWRDETDKPFVDRGLDLIRFDRLNGTTKGVLVTYPGHFNLGGNEVNLTSSDGAGYVERMMEARIADRQGGDAPVVGYISGTVGDSGVNEPAEENFYQETESSALDIVAGAMDVFDGLDPTHDFIVDSAAERFPPPPDHEVPNFPLLGGAPIPFMVSHSLHVQAFRIGDVILAGVPGEPVTELGWAIRDRIADLGLRGVPVSHANDWTGYIYTDEQYDAQEGRSDQGAYGRNQGWYLVDKALDLTKFLLDPGYDYGTFDRSALMLGDDTLNYAAAWATVTATPITRQARDAAVLPNIVLECGGLADATDVSRFGNTVFAWRGGNNGADLPFVELQRRVGDEWETVLNSEGFELHLYMKIYRVQPADPIVPGGPGCNELLDHQYSVFFEPSYDFPAGEYRFVSTGVFRTAPTVNEGYTATSSQFVVSPGTLDASVSVVDGDVQVELIYPVDPDGVRFRPRDTVNGTAEIEIDGVPAGTATFDASAGALVLSGASFGPGSTITVAGASDAWGNAIATPVSITL